MRRRYVSTQAREVRILSPREYLALSAKDYARIEHVEMVPPKLGSGSFGKFRVVYRGSSNAHA